MAAKQVKPYKISNVASNGHTARLSARQSLCISMGSPIDFGYAGDQQWEAEIISDYLSIQSVLRDGTRTQFVIVPKYDFSAWTEISTVFLGNVSLYIRCNDNFEMHAWVCVFLDCRNPSKKDVVTVINPTLDQEVKLEPQQLLEVILHSPASGPRWAERNIAWDAYPFSVNSSIDVKPIKEVCLSPFEFKNELRPDEYFFCLRRDHPELSGENYSSLMHEHHFFYACTPEAIARVKGLEAGMHASTKLVFLAKDDSGKVVDEHRVHTHLVVKSKEESQDLGKYPAAYLIEKVTPNRIFVEKDRLLINPNRVEEVMIYGTADKFYVELPEPSVHWPHNNKLEGIRWRMACESFDEGFGQPLLAARETDERTVDGKIVQRFEVLPTSGQWSKGLPQQSYLGEVVFTCGEASGASARRSIFFFYVNKTNLPVVFLPDSSAATGYHDDAFGYNHSYSHRQSEYYNQRSSFNLARQKAFAVVEFIEETVDPKNLGQGEVLYSHERPKYNGRVRTDTNHRESKDSDPDAYYFRGGSWIPQEQNRLMQEIQRNRNAPFKDDQGNKKIGPHREITIYNPMNHDEITLIRGQKIKIRLGIPPLLKETQYQWCLNVVPMDTNHRIWVHDSKIVKTEVYSYQEYTIWALHAKDMPIDKKRRIGALQFTFGAKERRLIHVNIEPGTAELHNDQYKEYELLLDEVKPVNHGRPFAMSHSITNETITLVNPIDDSFDVTVDDCRFVEIILSSPNFQDGVNGEWKLASSMSAGRLKCLDQAAWPMWDGQSYFRALFEIKREANIFFGEIVIYWNDKRMGRIVVWDEKKRRTSWPVGNQANGAQVLTTESDENEDHVLLTNWSHGHAFAITPEQPISIKLPAPEKLFGPELKSRALNGGKWSVEIVQKAIDTDLLVELEPDIRKVIDLEKAWYELDGVIELGPAPWDYQIYTLKPLIKQIFTYQLIEAMRKVYGDDLAYDIAELTFTYDMPGYGSWSQQLTLQVLNPVKLGSLACSSTLSVLPIDGTKFTIRQNEVFTLKTCCRRFNKEDDVHPWVLTSRPSWLHPLLFEKDGLRQEFTFVADHPWPGLVGELTLKCGHLRKRILLTSSAEDANDHDASLCRVGA